MKQVVAERDDIVFYIKMLPLKIHPQAYKKAQAIVCEKSLKLLERVLDGLGVGEPSCETTGLDETIAISEKLGITGTPTIILPDGGVLNGFKTAQELIRLIETSAVEAGKIGQETQEKFGPAGDEKTSAGKP